MDFARLLPLPALRHPLLKAHYTTNLDRPGLDEFHHKSYSSGRGRESSIGAFAVSEALISVL